MKITILLLVLTMTVVLSSQEICAQKRTWKVKTTGAMRAMFQTGDISGKTDVSKILNKKNLYGIGPLEHLSGEVMIWNSKSLTSYIKNKTVVVKTNPGARAVFFVWTNVAKWHEFIVPKRVKTYEELEKFIAESAEKTTLNSDEPFPFLLKGKFNIVEWHINDYKSDGAKVTHEKHDALKFKSEFKNVKLKMLGFYSPKHQGIFTHHTRTTHIHVTNSNETFVGHVDDLKLGKKIKLFLPVS